MDDFLKNARKQLDDLDFEAQFKDLDFSKLKDLDLKKQKKELRRQLEAMDARKREEDAANEGFFSGVLLGIVIGAIVALVFAPKSGGETREMVAETATDLKNRAEEMVGQAKDDAGNGSPTTPTAM